jgi:multiple sugar transport system permease protein
MKKKHRRLSLVQREAITGYLFVLPQMIGFLCFVLIPLISIFIFSLQSRNLLGGEVHFIGLENYRILFTADPLFYEVLTNTLIFTFGTTILNVTIAVFLAAILYQKIKGMTFFRSIFFSPVVTSSVAWVIVWSYLFQSKNGTINQLLFNIFHIAGPRWLADPHWAMFSLIITIVIKGVGLNMVIMLSAFTSIPQEIYEAAQIDGAKKSQTFFFLTLPMISPSILLISILTVIGALGVFDYIQLLTAGGPANSTMVLSYYVYHKAFKSYNVGYGSSIAVIVFLIALGLTILQWASRKRFVYGEN